MFIEGLKVLKQEKIDLHSLIVLRHDHLVLELYVHPYDRDTLHNVKSVSKSIISAVVGIALEKGTLPDLDRTVVSYLPQYFGEGTDPRKKKITLRHLLTMTSGLDLDENGPIMREVFTSDDWIQAAFRRSMVDEPGARFLYSTPLTHTMSGILTEVSGMSLLELTDELLFRPLGITQVRWTKGPRGYYFGGAEMFLRPIDMARFGQLFLHGGRWKGSQIVPEAWVRESTSNQLAGVDSGQSYGFWWWPFPQGGYAAMGWNGQAIRLMPDAGIVVVGTASDATAIDRMFSGFQDYEPSDEPLPPNRDAVEELEKLVREISHPDPRKPASLNPIARKISGRRYILEPNERGFTEVMLDFSAEETATMTLGTASDKHTFLMGMDGVYRLTETGDFGQMPGGENRFAFRGAWSGDDTLTIESHQMANPLQSTSVVTFTRDEIEMSVAIRPIDLQFLLRGKAVGEPAEESRD